MNVCDPDTSYENIKQHVERNVGRPLNLSRKQICELYTNIRQDRLLLPPLVMSSDKTYMIDKKSPFTQRNYEVLFDKSSLKSQLKRLATKCGALTEADDTKDEIKQAIFAKLRTLRIHEPIKLGRQRREITKNVNRANNIVNRVNNNIVNRANNNIVNRANNNVNRANNNVNRANNNVNRSNNNNVNSVNNNNVNRSNNNVNRAQRNISKRGTAFSRNFVPNFIKNTTTQGPEFVQRPRFVLPKMKPPTQRVSETPIIDNNNNSNNRRAIMPVMRAPEPSSSRGVLSRLIGRNKNKNGTSSNKKAQERKLLQKHMNSLKHISTQDVDEYFNRLNSNKSSLKNIISSSSERDETMKKRKEEILKKLGQSTSLAPITKSLYQTRLRSIQRGKSRTYLNNIESDILKNIEKSTKIQKETNVRKEFIGIETNQEARNKKYKELFNKYNKSRNTDAIEALKSVYNSVKKTRPRVPTNASELKNIMMKGELVRRNQERQLRNATFKMSQLNTLLNKAVKQGEQSQISNVQSQVVNTLKQMEQTLKKKEQSAQETLSRQGVPAETRVSLEKSLQEIEQQRDIIENEIAVATSTNNRPQREEAENRRVPEKAEKEKKENVLVNNKIAIQEIANKYRVDKRYVETYVKRIPGGVSSLTGNKLNAFANKVEEDRDIANMRGEKRVSFIEPAVSRRLVQTIKKQKFAKSRNISVDYLNAYMRAKKLNTLNQINNAELESKFKLDKKLMNNETTGGGALRKFLSRVRKVTYVPEGNVYNNRRQKADELLKEKRTKNIAKVINEKFWSPVAKTAGVKKPYIARFMNDRGLTKIENVTGTAVKEKANKDRALIKAEAKISGERVSSFYYIKNDDYKTRKAFVDLVEKLSDGDAKTRKEFVTEYLKKKNNTKAENVTNTTELMSLYKKATQLSKATGKPVKYPNANINKNIAILETGKKLQNAVNEYMRRRTNVEERERPRLLKQIANNTGVNFNDMKREVNGSEKAQPQKLGNTIATNKGVPRQFVNTYLESSSLTMNQLVKSKNEQNIMKAAYDKLIKYGMPFTFIKDYMKNVGKSKLNMSDIKALQEMYKKRKELANLEGVTNNLRYVPENELTRRMELAQKIKEQAEKTKKRANNQKSEAKKLGIKNLNVSVNEKANETIYEAKLKQHIKEKAAKNLSIKKLPNNVLNRVYKHAYNNKKTINNKPIMEMLIEYKLETMGVNSNWIQKYMNERKVNTLTTQVLRTAERQLTMSKNSNNKLTFMTVAGQVDRAKKLYFNTLVEELMKKYNVDKIEEVSKFVEEERKNQKMDYYQLRDKKSRNKIKKAFDKQIRDKNITRFRTKKSSLEKVKNNARETINKMGLGKHIGGRLTKNVVEGYLKQINGARSENNVGLILTGARKKYNSKPGIKRQPTNEGYVTANDENTQQKTTTRAAAATLGVRRPIKKTKTTKRQKSEPKPKREPKSEPKPKQEPKSEPKTNETFYAASENFVNVGLTRKKFEILPKIHALKGFTNNEKEQYQKKVQNAKNQSSVETIWNSAQKLSQSKVNK